MERVPLDYFLQQKRNLVLAYDEKYVPLKPKPDTTEGQPSSFLQKMLDRKRRSEELKLSTQLAQVNISDSSDFSSSESSSSIISNEFDLYETTNVAPGTQTNRKVSVKIQDNRPPRISVQIQNDVRNNQRSFENSRNYVEPKNVDNNNWINHVWAQLPLQLQNKSNGSQTQSTEVKSNYINSRSPSPNRHNQFPKAVIVGHSGPQSSLRGSTSSISSASNSESSGEGEQRIIKPVEGRDPTRFKFLNQQIKYRKNRIFQLTKSQLAKDISTKDLLEVEILQIKLKQEQLRKGFVERTKYWCWVCGRDNVTVPKQCPDLKEHFLMNVLVTE